MTSERILDIADSPAGLRIRHEQLVLKTQDREASIPLAELAVLVVSHPQVTYTQPVLAGLVEHGAALIVCDRRHMPAGMLLPVEGHHLQAERFDTQAHASLPTRKRLWQQIVRAKIKAQARLLDRINGKDFGLSGLVRRVRSGDPQNVEATAARRYWTALFGKGFRRNRDAEDHNRNLNYGYAVLRAAVARGICAAGLHPSLGLHHHNRYDAFCLASDLAEPFRPVVDGAVHEWVSRRGTKAAFDKSAKEHLLNALTARYNLRGEWRTLFDIVARTAVTLAHVFEGNRKALELPEI